MTLILEFEHKFIFYKPGILRFALRRARTQLRAAQGRADRHRLLSLSLKHAWAEAKAQLAGFQRVRVSTPAWRGERSQQAHMMHCGSPVVWVTTPSPSAIAPPEAASAALTSRQLH